MSEITVFLRTHDSFDVWKCWDSIFTESSRREGTDNWVTSCPWGEIEAQRGEGTGWDPIRKANWRSMIKPFNAPSSGLGLVGCVEALLWAPPEDQHDTGSSSSYLRWNQTQHLWKCLSHLLTPSLKVPQVVKSSKPHSKGGLYLF